MLFIIGLGLADLEDITLKGLKAIQSSERVYLEAYTSVLGVNKDELEKFYNKTILIADREMVEQNSDDIIQNADSINVSFLVVGDPFGATTHSDLVLRAIEKEIPYKIIHNTSIMNAIGCCGLQLYNYGETISICFWTDSWKPKSFFTKININRKLGLHTLCLLDIKVKEKTVENLIKKRNIYEPPKYMSVAQACTQLYDIVYNPVESKTDDDENHEGESEDFLAGNTIFESTLCVGLARIGSDTQVIVADSLVNLKEVDLGSPLHSLIVAGRLHPLEADFLRLFYKGSKENFDNLVEIHNKFYSN
jgi:diphthine synthase